MSNLICRHLAKTIQTPETMSGEMPVLDNLSLSLTHDEMLAVVGPGSCGKSILLNILAGLDTADEGEFLLNDTPISPAALRARCPLVCPTPTLFPWMTIARNIEWAMRRTGLPRPEIAARAARYLELIQLSNYHDYYPKHLPDSLKQIAAIARALAARPDVVLLDDPAACLPAQPRLFFWERLLLLRQQEPFTALLVTSSLDEAILLADSLVLLTPRPASVLQTLRVDLPKPRSRELLTDPRFNQIKRQAMNALAI